MNINKTINRHWRDWAALVYLFICLVDFFIAPLMWNIGMAMESDEIKLNTSRWMPLTLQAGAMKKSTRQINKYTNAAQSLQCLLIVLFIFIKHSVL